MATRYVMLLAFLIVEYTPLQVLYRRDLSHASLSSGLNPWESRLCTQPWDMQDASQQPML